MQPIQPQKDIQKIDRMRAALSAFPVQCCEFWTAEKEGKPSYILANLANRVYVTAQGMVQICTSGDESLEVYLAWMGILKDWLDRSSNESEKFVAECQANTGKVFCPYCCTPLVNAFCSCQE